MDLSRLRSLIRTDSTRQPVRELTYEYGPQAADVSHPGDPFEAAACLGATVVDAPPDICLVVDRWYGTSDWHGRMRIGDCAVDATAASGLIYGPLRRRPPTAQLEFRDNRSAPGRLVFFDLETTGVSGGAGTLAFIVGCGEFENGGFHTRQFFLSGFAAEKAMLRIVSQWLEAADTIVTYNGKTFDLPVVETRCLFHRVPHPLEGRPHLDMVHPARRLWRSRSQAVITPDERASCRLATLERVLLDVNRPGDVNGWEIPARYFHFIRSGDAAPLLPVFEHNRLDLLSLAAITSLACRLVHVGATATEGPGECLALGRLYEQLGEGERAAECYHRTARLGEGQGAHLNVTADALRRLALRRRRDRRHVEAFDAWQRLMVLQQEAGTIGCETIEALAIHYEHRAKDLEAARGLARQALARSLDPPRERAFRHRLARLDRKIASPGGRRSPGRSARTEHVQIRLLDLPHDGLVS